MVSDAKRRANAKWNKENLATVACILKKDKAKQFREKCEAHGRTMNDVLKEFVDKFIEAEE